MGVKPFLLVLLVLLLLLVLLGLQAHLWCRPLVGAGSQQGDCLADNLPVPAQQERPGAATEVELPLDVGGESRELELDDGLEQRPDAGADDHVGRQVGVVQGPQGRGQLHPLAVSGGRRDPGEQACDEPAAEPNHDRGLLVSILWEGEVSTRCSDEDQRITAKLQAGTYHLVPGMEGEETGAEVAAEVRGEWYVRLEGSPVATVSNYPNYIRTKEKPR